MSNLLIDERPLMVLPNLAEEVGLNEAILLQQIHYWIKKKLNKKDNRYWVYNTYDGWQVQFPFWSTSTIRRTINSLEDKELLIIGNYNKAGFDKTKWYTIDYVVLNRMSRPSVQNEQTMESKWTDGAGQNEQTNTIDYSKTTSESNKTDSSKAEIPSSSTSKTKDFNKLFEEWWNLYNLKKDRKKCVTRYKTLLREYNHEDMIEGTNKYLEHRKSLKEKGEFVPQQRLPSTFLNNENFNDEYEMVAYKDTKKENKQIEIEPVIEKWRI